MNKLGRLVVCGIVFAALLGNCQEAPVTGRNQLILLPESQDAELGLEAYQQILAQSEVSDDSELNQRVQEVGKRIAAASPHPEWDWQFTLIEDETPNAFALPGGKVGVHTGLFKVAENDAQLAAVMGHEVGHAIARHGAERMSQQMVVQGGLGAAGAVLGTQVGSPDEIVQLAAQAATLGVILPFSREQEAEADHIGVLLMAEAGYDPRESVKLWENFAELGGERAPEFLSTHPAPESRIERLQSLMPEAIEVYEETQGESS